MSKAKQHVQARLRKGQTEMVAWIPLDCAIVGKMVDLDDPEHGEALGWEVLETFPASMLDSKWVNERSRDHLNMRKMTDV